MKSQDFYWFSMCINELHYNGVFYIGICVSKNKKMLANQLPIQEKFELATYLGIVSSFLAKCQLLQFEQCETIDPQ